MNSPRLSIRRLDSSVYEWAIEFAGQIINSGAGVISVTECLREATTDAAVETRYLEIVYRGFHLGTFKVDEAASAPGQVAEHIMAAYASLQ